MHFLNDLGVYIGPKGEGEEEGEGEDTLHVSHVTRSVNNVIH